MSPASPPRAHDIGKSGEIGIAGVTRGPVFGDNRGYGLPIYRAICDPLLGPEIIRNPLGPYPRLAS